MGGKLLITDDAMIIRQMIADVASGAGWEVVGQAGNGQEAIEMYEQLRPDVVTMDIVMPDFDGLHAVQGIRKIDPNAAVIMVTALDQKDLLKQAFQHGAVDFICKPFDRDKLLETLDSSLSAATS